MPVVTFPTISLVLLKARNPSQNKTYWAKYELNASEKDPQNPLFYV